MNMSPSFVQQAEEIMPGAAVLPIGRRLRAWVPAIVTVVVMLSLAISLDLTPATFFRGVGRLGGFFASMWPPTDGGQLGRILGSIAQTFAMAFAGTSIAVVVSIPFGLIGAKTIVPFAPVHFIIRRIFDFFRGVPVLVWALVLVSAFGLGPFAGVIALVLADIPTMSKLYAEAFENVDPKPAEGMRAAGVGHLTTIRFAIFPQVFPVLSSLALYFLESNFRNAAVLGIVGAGGIGFELEERIRIFAFDEVMFIIVLYMVCVAALDLISGKIRARLV